MAVHQAVHQPVLNMTTHAHTHNNQCDALWKETCPSWLTSKVTAEHVWWLESEETLRITYYCGNRQCSFKYLNAQGNRSKDVLWKWLLCISGK